ncbi:MAG: glycosyltransferase family 4 protein [Bacteroidales bacterium]|nr:glycosyltransferase family 4 protein [Bacteroidales bacterium]
MNILVLSHKPPFPSVDGGTIATMQLINDLAEQGNSVTVLSMSTPKHPSDNSKIPPEIRQKIHFNFVNIDTTISIKGLIKNFLQSDLPYTAERFISKDFQIAIKNILHEFSFDVVQLEGLYLAPYIDLIKKESNVPISLRAHNIEYEIWKKLAKKEINPIKKYYLRNLSSRIEKFEHDVINKYDVLIPITIADKKAFNQMGNTKPSKVVPVGIHQVSNHDIPNVNQKPSLFYLGALDWRPNTEGLKWFVKKVWPSIRKEYPGIEFFIAGRNAPQSFANKMKHPGIKFLGEIEDAGAFIQQHAIMIVPLFSGSGMRVKIIEAMSYGKAIVTTRLGAEGIDCTHGENIMMADNVAGQITSIKNIIDNPDFYTKLCSNAHQLIQEKYVGCNLAKKLIDFYKKHFS